MTTISQCKYGFLVMLCVCLSMLRRIAEIAAAGVTTINFEFTRHHRGWERGSQVMQPCSLARQGV